MRGAETVAKRLQRERGPSTAVLGPSARGAETQDPVLITIERTICYGLCPSYRVSIKEDGTVTYTGDQHVKTTGEHTWKIDPAAVRTLAREMHDAGFFDMKDEYRAMVTDNPTTYTSLTMDGRTKKIQDYVAGPPRLKQLENRIDDVSGVKKYISVRTSCWLRSPPPTSPGCARWRQVRPEAADDLRVTLGMRRRNRHAETSACC